MSVPSYINDGNYNVEQQVGCDEWQRPFSAVGDQRSFEVHRTYRVSEPKYKAMRPMTRIKTREGFAYLVEESEASNIGLGILEFKRVFASVPQSRKEGTTIANTVQFLSTSVSYDWTTPPPEPSVTEITGTTAGIAKYEYFLGLPEPLIAPRVAVLFGSVVQFGDWGNLQIGRYYPAEDSEVGIYKGGIYFRRTIYVKFTGFVRVS